MTTFSRVLQDMRTRAMSPDRTVEATWNWSDGVSVVCRPGTLRHHSPAGFARQVEWALSRLASNSDRARRRAFGTSPRPHPEPWLAVTDTIEVEAASPRGLVRIRLHGFSGYHVDVAHTVGTFCEETVTEEVNAALHSVNERFAARSAARQAKPLHREALTNAA